MGEFRVTASDFVFERQGTIKDTYKIGSKVGEGAFGSVRKITHRLTGEVRAVKTIHKKNMKTEDDNHFFFNEITVLRSLDHPNILKLYEFYQDEKNYYIITEYCSGGELFDRVIANGFLSEAVAAEYMKQILSVLVYCHDRSVVHRDLKPENFMLASPEHNASLKVIDFGTADFFRKGEKMRSRFGSPYYIAPEVLRRNYDEKCDVWSAGVNLYILLSGNPPFDGANDEQILKKVEQGQYDFSDPEWDSISDDAKDLISKMMTYDPDQRITARQALQHPWLTNAPNTPIDEETARKILRNLQTFKSGQQLHKATLTFITSQLTTKQERDDMIEIFKRLDTDKNGTISREELIRCFQTLNGESEDLDAEVEKIMHQVDINLSGEIDYNEFIMANLNRRKLLSKSRLEATFQTFDTDNSGTITAEELRNILSKCQKFDDSMLDGIITEADQNGDGVIDLKEFVATMSRVLDI
jgi:calcium-dependent protein kinase